MPEGRDALDHRQPLLHCRNYAAPGGIETLSAALSEPRDALEEIVEPFLLQQGFIGRTPRGRVLTLRAYKHLGLTGRPAPPPLRSAVRTIQPMSRRRQNKHGLTPRVDRLPSPQHSILCRHTTLVGSLSPRHFRRGERLG